MNVQTTETQTNVEMENYVNASPPISTIDVSVITAKPTTEQIRYRFIAQLGVTVAIIGGSVYTLVQSGEQINTASVCTSIISGLIMLHVKNPKLY